MINFLLFGLLSLFWGGSFVAIKYLIEDIPSFTAAFYRVFFAIIFLFIIYRNKLSLPIGWWGRELFFASIAGLCSIGIPFSLLFWGERFVSPSIAGILNGTVPFWTLIISILFFGGGKDITKKKILGLVMGVSGLSFIFGPKLTLSGNLEEVYGLVALVVMALFYSVGINLNKKILSHNKIIVKSINTIVQQIVSLIYLCIILLIIDGIPDFSLLTKTQNYLSVIYLSLFSTCFAFIIFYRLIAVFGAVKASTVTFFVPPIALLLDGLIYGRRLSLYESLGALIIILSMFMLKEQKKLSTPAVK